MPTWKPTKPRPPRNENAWKQRYFDRPVRQLERPSEQIVQLAQLLDRGARVIDHGGRTVTVAGCTFLARDIRLVTELRLLQMSHGRRAIQRLD